MEKHFLRCLNVLEDPTDGYVFFEGADLCDLKVDINIQRRKMGMVFQNFNLFNNMTVLKNITFAPVHVQTAELRKLKRINLILKLKNLFKKKSDKTPLLPVETSVKKIKVEAEENALRLLRRIGLEDKAKVYPSTLSGGQRQRLCIARALLKKPKILILDDSTSAVDTATEARIRQCFATDLKDTTKIIIAQRIGSVEEADRILVLDGGRVADIGTHAELIARPGIYREIYDIQMSSDDRALIQEGGDA